MRKLRGFTYILDPLRKKCDWELQALTLQLAHINEEIASQRERVDVIDAELGDMNAMILKTQRTNMVIDIDRFCIAHGYQRHLHQQLRSAENRFRQIEDERDRTMDSAHRLQRYAEGLDEHRDESIKEYSKGLGKAAMLESDDAWMRSRNRREAE
jgi:hypothetical protein